MTSDNTENKQPRYTLKPTFTPLPHSQSDTSIADTGKCAAKKLRKGPQHATGSSLTKDSSKNDAEITSVIRAANEDDDLYDPYSDYHDGTLRAATFEEDPWR